MQVGQYTALSHPMYIMMRGILSGFSKGHREGPWSSVTNLTSVLVLGYSIILSSSNLCSLLFFSEMACTCAFDLCCALRGRDNTHLYQHYYY